MSKTSHNWSAEQVAIFEWFANGQGSLLVRARAGTGKTTTIKEAFNHAPENRMLYAVFNKKNQREAEGKITDTRVEVKTLHSLGFAFIKRVWSSAKPDDEVEYDRAEAVLAGRGVASKEILGSVVKLVAFLKNTAVNPSEEDAYGIAQAQDCLGNNPSEDEIIVQSALGVLEASKQKDPAGRISFNDMVWLPVAMNWVRQWYDLVCVDEAQDMNTPQLMMARQAVKQGGRVVVVGDDRQAIYGFRGAAQGGMAMMKVALRASELTLTTTYRCPKLVVAKARELVPDYRVHESAPEGLIHNVNEAAAMATLKPGDAVLSRLNAPLMPLALALLRKEVPARIEGRDIGKQLVGMVRSMKATTVAQFVEKVNAWAAKQKERFAGFRNQELAAKKCEQISDMADTLIALSEGCSEVRDIDVRITNLFQDTDQNSRPAVILSSVHKAKGLEWPRVFLLSETFRKNGSSNGEESNIYYVAITRSMRELYFVAGKGEAPSQAAPEAAPKVEATPEPQAVVTAPTSKPPPRKQAQKEASSDREQPVPAPISPAQQFLTSPSATEGGAASEGVAVAEQASTLADELDPRLWKFDGRGSWENAPAGQFYRTRGMVFLYGKMEYVVIEANSTCAKSHPLQKISRVRKTEKGDGEGNFEEVSKVVEFYPKILKTSTTIDRASVLRTMPESEIIELLEGKRPKPSSESVSGANQQTTESDDGMPKEKAKKSATKSQEGRADFIIGKFNKGVNKNDAWTATHEKFGWNTDKGKAAFDKTWAKAERLKKGEKAAAKSSAKPAAKGKTAKASAGKKSGPPTRPAAPAPAAAAAPAPAAPVAAPAPQAAPAPVEPAKV